jgi:hypothetical protein
MATLIKIAIVIAVILSLIYVYKTLKWYINLTEYEPKHVTLKVFGCMARATYLKTRGNIARRMM